MWEIAKRSLTRERRMAGGQFALSRRESVQKLHGEIVDAFLRAGRQSRKNEAISFAGIETICSDEQRGMRTGIWRAVSNLGFAIAMAIRLLNPYVLITAAFGSHRSIFEHLSARVDSMRAVLSPRTGRRRRLTAWLQDTLPQRHIPEAASAVWEDGSLLCGIVESAVSGACPGYDALSHPNTDRCATLWLGQKLVSRYLGVPPVFSEQELLRPYLTVAMERRLLRYLAAVRAAVVRVEAERDKRMKSLSASPIMIADDRLSSDCIAQSVIGMEESMLECVARGMGLILGAKGRSSTFYIYLNPNHPHRHIHRLMQSSNLQFENDCVEGEAGAILMQIRGPDGDFGAALISTVPNSTSSCRRSSINLTESWCGRIPITYSTTEERVKVSYIPLSNGIHELSLLLRGGSHVPGSPFSVTVEESMRIPTEEDVHGGGLWKASSCDSGLNKFRARSGSIDSDPGLDGSWETGSLRQKKRVISRIVDFVTEKMILTEDGKLERMPRGKRAAEKKHSEKEAESVGGENETQISKRYTSTGPSRSKTIQDELDDRNPEQKLALKITPSLSEEHTIGFEKHWEGSSESIPKKKQDLYSISNAVDPFLSRKGPVDFRDHCRRILWLCDILLKYTPRQEGIEILSTAGDILGGKRVHPTIMEESEPEEGTPSPSEGNNAVMTQRLQRTRSDSNGLNELSRWNGARRSLHTWSRSERSDSVSSGRLLHKGGSYRGVVVRDLNAEAITGAYAGGDDNKDEKEKVDKEEEEKMKEYLREGRPMPRKPHFSMRRRVAERTSEASGAATESLEQSTVPDAEKQPGMAEISGKDSNKHVTTKNTQPISYKENKTETKGVISSGGDANKVTHPSVLKSDVDKTTESKQSAPHGNEESTQTAMRKCDIEIKVTSEDDEILNKKAPETSITVSDATSSNRQTEKQNVTEVISEESLLEKVKKDSSLILLEKVPILEVTKEGKESVLPSEKEALPDVKSSTTSTLLEGKKIEEPSITIISTQNKNLNVELSVEEKSTSTTAEHSHVDLPNEDLSTIMGHPRVDEQAEEKAEDILNTKAVETSVILDESLKKVEEIRKQSASTETVKNDISDAQQKTSIVSTDLQTEDKEREEVKTDRTLGAARRTPISSYTHMISRMLCTDSFPRESLEWFEGDERVEGELEGTLEPMGDLKTEDGASKEPWGDEDTKPSIGLDEDLDVILEPIVGEVNSGGERIPTDSTNPHPDENDEENKERPRSKFTEAVKRSGVGVGVGVGVVIAGGIVSKEDNSSPERKRSEWWRRDSSRSERMIEMAKQGSIERHWEAISTGIDAMEDGSIRSIITGVVGGLKEEHARNPRRWSDSEEAKEDMGKKEEETKPSPREYGEERTSGHSITEIPREWGKGTAEHLQSGTVLKEEASGVFERRGVPKGMDSSREGGVRKKKDSERGSIPVGEWWSLGEKAESGAWGGSREPEVGKLGRRTPEEGVEVKEWEGACGTTERHKGGKEGLPSVSGGRSDDPHREKRGRGAAEASLKHEKIEKAKEAGEVSGAEDLKERRRKGGVQKGGERKSSKETVEEIKVGSEMDGRRKEKGKRPLSTGTEFSSESAESENKYSPAAIKESLRDGGESCGKATKGGRNQVLVKSTKGVVLGSVVEGKREACGAMEMGIEKVDDLLGSLIDITKDNRMNEPGSSPKKVGEDMCGVQISLDDWGGKDGPETEVIVGEYEEVDEDEEDGAGKGEKCMVFEGDVDAKVGDKNWMNESDTPLLIMEETSGKRQYNFTLVDDALEDIKSTNEVNNEVVKEQKAIEVGEKKETNLHTQQDVANSTSELPNQSLKSLKVNESTSAKPNVEEEKPKKKLIEPRKTEKVAERQLSVEEDDNVEEVPRESCETTYDFDYRGESSQRNKNNYPDLEELLGSDFSCKTTTYRAQFNLWPSEEAFGEKKVAETLENVLKGKSPMTGVVAGILGNPTHFSRVTTITSEPPNLQRTFKRQASQESGDSSEGNEEDVEIIEQDFDDRSDELPERTNDETDFIGFDLYAHPKSRSGDAFLIFESPGVTTYFPFEEPTEQKQELELRGGWEEVTLFLDEQEASGGSAKITEIKDDEDSSQKNKTFVLPAGRWSNRLSMSPAMSAISEEEAEEAFPDRDQKDSSLDTGGEPARWDSYDDDTSDSETRENRDRPREEKAFDSATFRRLMEGLAPKIPLEEPKQNKSIPNQLPILPIEIEDGFGESFTRRRSSTPSVVNDLGDAPAASADCGAAFVVSSELAVTLALGVSITQIIPPEVDHPQPIPQAEEGADAIAMEKAVAIKPSVSVKEQAIQTELHLLDMEHQPKPSTPEQRGWILIDTTEEEKARAEKVEGDNEWRVESVGEVEEAASLTIAEENALLSQRSHGGAIKKESWSGKAECREKREGDTGSRTMDSTKEGTSRQSGRDNEASSRFDGNDFVKGKDSFGRRKRGAPDGMNITGGDGSVSSGKDGEEWAFESGRIESSEDASRRGRGLASEDTRGNTERSKEFDGERMVTSPSKHHRRESLEGDKERSREETRRGDELMVDKILELTFGDRTSPKKGSPRLARRESVFDDYKFDLWEKGFELKAPKRTVETQDSTGLEYYLSDVEQLLNLELEATEQEVKYISAKEIMENFTKVIESPEKVSESTSSGEWSNTKGIEIQATDEPIHVASGSRDERVGASQRSEKNLWEEDLPESALKSQNSGPQTRGEGNKTIDELLFGDDISFEPQSAETETNKPCEWKGPSKKEAEEKVSEGRDESPEKLLQQNRNWEEEHALAKKKREQTKRERSAEHKSPKLSDKRRCKNLGIFKTFDKSEESLNLEEESKKDGSACGLSFPKSPPKEEAMGEVQPEAEEREAIERENSASTSRDTYPSLTDSSGEFSSQEKSAKEKSSPSNKRNDFSERGDEISVDVENINATDSAKLRSKKISGSDRSIGIKPSSKEKLSEDDADFDVNVTGKSVAKGSDVEKGEKPADKSDEAKESEGKKGGKPLQETKTGSQSSSLDEYRRAVSEAYAFLDVQDSIDSKLEDEPIKKKTARRESVSWNAAVARVDSWDSWSVISGAETGRMQETTGLDEITSSESSLSSPLSETRKTTDPTESTASSTKDTSTEETPDTRSRQKHKKSKEFDPDDEALFQTKMTVSSRKEYWDKRLEDIKTKSESISSPPAKKPSAKHSDAKKGRISFQQSSSATENSDSGKSSGESSTPEKRGVRQSAAVQRKRESTKTTVTQNVSNVEGSDKSALKTTTESSSDSDAAKVSLDDRTGISELSEVDLSMNDNLQKGARKEKTVKESKAYESESSSDKSTGPKRVEKKRSALVENAEKMLLKAYTSDDEKSERKVPSIRVKGIVSRSKIELEKHSSSPPESERKAKQREETQTAESTELFTDSSSPSEDGDKAKKASKVSSKNGESVTRLSKIFSANDDTQKDVKSRRKVGEISEDTDSEKLISSSSEKGYRPVTKKTTSEGKTPTRSRDDVTFESLIKRRSTRHAEVASEDEEGFVARKRMYWDSMRTMSLDTVRRDSVDSVQSPEKSDVKKVRSMWERRASLDAVPLTEERLRIGKKFFSESMAKGKASSVSLREASTERDSSSVKFSKKEITTSDPKPKTKTPMDMSVTEKKTIVHKSAPSTASTESRKVKTAAQTSVKKVKKVSSDKVKSEEGSGDTSPSKPVSSEKVRVVKKVSRSEAKPTDKDNAKGEAVEDKPVVKKVVSSEKKVVKRVVKVEKTSEEKVGTAESASTGKTAEKVSTSQKVLVKKIKPKQPPSTELKESTEIKVAKEPSVATPVAKPESQTVSSKEKKITKKRASEPILGQKLVDVKASQETKSPTEPLRTAKVLSPQRRESLTPKDAWDSDEERKAMEYALTRKRRSSVEIRVTDDEDVCVMREITVIPVFPNKRQMETYEEEEEEGKDIKSFQLEWDDRRREDSPVTRRRSSLPPRSLTSQFSGLSMDGKQRYDSGKSPTKYASSTSEESISKGTVKKKKTSLPILEERQDIAGVPTVRRKSSGAGAAESKHRATPATDREYQRAELSEEGYAEKMSATSARGERGDDGRTATSRRAAKGTAPIQKTPPSAASSPDSDPTDLPRSFLSAPTAALRRHSAAADSTRTDMPTKRRGSGDLGSPRKSAECKKRFSRAKQFFENMEKGKDSPPEMESETPKSKKKKPRGTVTDVESIGKEKRKSSSRRRSPLRNLDVKDDSESTPDSDKQITESERLQQRRRSRRGSCDLILHSAPGSDVDNMWDNPQKALQRRKKGGEPILRSQMFGGSERQPRVSERFNVMDLFKDVAGVGTGGSGDLSGRATPLGIPHQAAVLAALRSVEDVRSSEARSPYDLYRPVEAVDDCVPSPAASPDVNANEEGGTEEGLKAEDDNDNFESSMTLHSKKEYQAEYPHLPITSPRRSRHRSSHVDLIPRNVLLKLDNTQSSSKTTPSRTRSQAELF